VRHSSFGTIDVINDESVASVASKIDALLHFSPGVKQLGNSLLL